MSQLNDTNKKDLLAAKEIKKREGVSLPVAAMRMHPNNINNDMYWPEPVGIEDDASGYVDADLISHGGWLGEFAASVASSVQFPPNTAFLHLLGILACGTAKSFRYEYYGDTAAVNLYTVTAQPSSSGKSGIHRRYTTPFQISLKEFNRQNSIEQAKIQKQIDDLEAQVKETEKQGGETIDQLSEIADLCDERDKLNRVEFAFDDITPEAAEAAAVRQNGLINIASAEADALNIILGDVYKGQSSKANYGMFLKTWDMEWHAPSRVTRNTKAGYVYGSVSVIAQQAAIQAILEAGMSGRGISERMLLLSERPVIGHRDHSMYKPVDRVMLDNYQHLCRNIINEKDEVILKLSNEAIQLIVEYRNRIEPKLADDGEYSNAMIRGAMGKADKQIIKIACLLHIGDQWSGEYPRGGVTVGEEVVASAISIFDELSKTYIQAAETLGYAGENPEILCLIESLERLMQTRKSKVTFRQFRDRVKNLKAMKNLPGITQKLRENHLPRLERLGYVAIDGDTIYINPKLK